jgi:hypothetical protein
MMKVVAKTAFVIQAGLLFKNETTDKCGRLMNQGAPAAGLMR